MIHPCGCCDRLLSEELLEEHHKVPQSLNGSNDAGNLILICGTCHTAIHALARLLKKSAVLAQNFLEDNYRNNLSSQKLLLQLAKTIIYEEEQDPDKDHINVFLKVPIKTHQILSDLSKASRINMHDYILGLIDAAGRRSTERGEFRLKRK